MRIGVDISQIVHEGTGVGRYVRRLVESLLRLDSQNEYVLFGASLRQRHRFYEFFETIRKGRSNVQLTALPIPPTILELLWNKLQIIPIEWFIGKVDIFWSSDWTQPPLAKAFGITTIHDLSILKYPESFNHQIVAVQKRRLSLAKKTCQMFLCDSQATRQDVIKLLGIEETRLKVIYPGFN